MLVVGGNAVETWVLLVIAIKGKLGMEIVGRVHAGRSQEGLATQRDMPEKLPCARWEYCSRIMGRTPCGIFV